MKKVLLFFSLVAMAFNAYAANYVTIDDVRVRPGSSVDLVVMYHFDSELICAYQFDLQLPEGVTADLTKAESGPTTPSTFIVGSNDLGNGHYRFATFSFGNGTGNEPITDHEGVLMTLTLNADASLVAGTELDASAYELIFPENNGTQYDLPDVSFKIILDDDALDTVLDENETEVPGAKNDANVKVIRTIKANEWSTICLPFDMTEEQVQEAFGAETKLGDFSDWEAYSLEDDEDYIYRVDLKFNNVEAIQANHPYIIKTPQDISDFDVLHVNIAPNLNAVKEIDHAIKIGGKTYHFYSYMRGNYVAGKILDKNNLFLSDNKFWYSAGSTKIKAFRAYFDVDDKLTKVKGDASSKINIVMNDEVTSIEKVNGQINDDRIYSVSGQYRGTDASRLQRGVYIVNGKKVVKK